VCLGDIVAEVVGSARTLLVAERTALNFSSGCLALRRPPAVLSKRPQERSSC
jgi:hypothetical protein